MTIATIIILYLLLIIIYIIPNLKNKQKKELYFNIGATIISFVIIILYTVKIFLPSPSNMIKDLIIKVFNMK